MKFDAAKCLLGVIYLHRILPYFLSSGSASLKVAFSVVKVLYSTSRTCILGGVKGPKWRWNMNNDRVFFVAKRSAPDLSKYAKQSHSTCPNPMYSA